MKLSAILTVYVVLTVKICLSFKCYSDDLCRLYGDCCAPIKYEPPDLTSLSCVSGAAYGLKHKFENQWIWMRDQCNSVKCAQELSLTLPLSLSDLPVKSPSNILYRNTKCAVCNSESESTLQYPQVNVMCDSEFEYSRDSRSRVYEEEKKNKSEQVDTSLRLGLELPNKCKYSFLFEKPLRKCLKGLVTTCHNTSASLSDKHLCLNSSTSYIEKIMCGNFRNKHCEACFNRKCLDIDVPFGMPRGGLSSLINFRVSIRQLQKEPQINQSDNTSNVTVWQTETEVTVLFIFSILRLICLIISVLSLVTLLVVYITLPSLRNRAGILIGSHAASLLLALILQCIMSIQENLYTGFCLTFGFVEYFFLIATFVWAVLFGADLLMTLSRSSRSSGKLRLKIFVVLGWLLSLVMSCILIVLHFEPSIGPVLGGSNSNCWFLANHRVTQLCLVFAPLALTLLFNTIILITLGCTLYSSYVKAPSSNDAHRLRKLGIMTLKVSVILGAAWLPTFLVIAAGGGAILIAVAEIPANLHGFFLAVAFIGNRRVRGKLSEMTSSVFKTTSTDVSTSMSNRRKSNDGIQDKLITQPA